MPRPRAIATPPIVLLTQDAITLRGASRCAMPHLAVTAVRVAVAVAGFVVRVVRIRLTRWCGSSSRPDDKRPPEGRWCNNNCTAPRGIA